MYINKNDSMWPFRNGMLVREQTQELTVRQMEALAENGLLTLGENLRYFDAMREKTLRELGEDDNK